MPSLDHSVKYSGKFHKINKALEDTSDDDDDDDDIIENMPICNEKETTNSLDHSVKHDDKFDKRHKALEDTFDDSEGGDDTIGNMPVSNEKEATNTIKNDQNTVGSDYEAIDRNEWINNVTESTFSEGDGIQIYLDDIIIYEDENKENETDHNDRDFINTDDILDYLMPKRIVPETSELNITENSSNNKESIEGFRNHESQGIDHPKQGGKTRESWI